MENKNVIQNITSCNFFKHKSMNVASFDDERRRNFINAINEISVILFTLEDGLLNQADREAISDLLLFRNQLTELERKIADEKDE